MKLLRSFSTQIVLAAIVALQMSCGDSSGPGNSAASIEANSSTTIGAAPGTAVAEVPSVIVRDASNNPLSGVSVTFAVTAGGGSITGGHAVSNASGVATVGSWTLGTAGGTNTLTATTGGLAPITFTAQGADPCDITVAHTLGTTSNGQLTLSDCDLGDGSFVDLYSINIPSAGTYLFTQSANFDTYLFLVGSQSVIAENDNGAQTNTSFLKAILPAGLFVLGPNSLQPGVTGTYSLTSAATTAEVTNCENVFTTAGITSQQSLQTSDCSLGGIFGDVYLIYLTGNRTITASMSSSAVDSYLELTADGGSAILASNDDIDGTTQNARLTFTAPSNAAGYYVLTARTKVAGVTGAYTLAIQ
jgi:hypothetical protein